MTVPVPVRGLLTESLDRSIAAEMPAVPDSLQWDLSERLGFR